MDESVDSADEILVAKRKAKRSTLEVVDGTRSELLDEVYAGDRKTTKAAIRELFPYIVVSRKHGMSWEKLADMMSSRGLPVTSQTLAKYYTEFRADRELPHVKRLIKQIEKNKELFDIRRSLHGSHEDIVARAEEALRKASESSQEAQRLAPNPPAYEPFKSQPQEALLPKLLADAVTLEKRGRTIADVTCSLILQSKYVYHAGTGEPFFGPLPSHQGRMLERAGKLN